MSRALSVEFIIDSGNVGGAETQLLTLCHRLKDAGHRPSVLFLQLVGPMAEQLDELSIPYSHVRDAGAVGPDEKQPLRGSLSSLRAYARFGRRSSAAPDIVHAMLDGPVAASRLLRPRAAIHVAGVLGMRIEGSGLNPAARARGLLFGRNVRRADAVVCNAPHLQTEVVSQYGLDPARVHVIPNGVDVPAWAADPGVDPPTGVVVANFHVYKGHDVLVEAVALLASPPTIRLCGTGTTREATRSRAAALGLADVQFVEPPADVDAELRGAQFGVHPSRTEGLSNAVLEEMAAGLPVIACDVGGNRQLIEPGVNGFLVPAGDERALSDAIATLAADPALRVQMGQESRRKAEALSWTACAGAHMDLYSSLTERPRAPRS